MGDRTATLGLPRQRAPLTPHQQALANERNQRWRDRGRANETPDKPSYDHAYRERNRERIRAQRAAYYQAHKEERRIKDAAAYAADPEKRRARSAAYWQSHRTDVAAARRWWAYRLDPEVYRQLLIGQAGRCAICGLVPTKTLHVDHDHDTGIVRGLLCESCNAGLGRFRDDPKRLLVAAQYLARAV